MLFSLLNGDPIQAIRGILLVIPTVLIALTFHEYAHGFVAYKLGDPTARNLGRLTLNPIKHFDPIGSVCMLLFGFGWAKPVPINTRYFKNPRKGMALTALAGPLTNLSLGLIGIIVYCIVFRLASKGVDLRFSFEYIPNTDSNMLYALFLFLIYFVNLNIALAVFNLIPVPPFDGSRIFYVFLPDRIYFSIMKYERIIMIVVLLGFAFNIFSISELTGLIGNGVLKLMNLIFFG